MNFVQSLIVNRMTRRIISLGNSNIMAPVVSTLRCPFTVSTANLV